MDRGWNDPPVFQCESGSDSAATPSKSKLQLNKRVAYPSSVVPKTESNSFLTPKSNRYPEIASSPPRLHPFLKGAPPKAPSCIDDSPITCPIPSTPSASTPIPASASLAPESTAESTLTTADTTTSSSSALSPSEGREKVIQCFRTLIVRLGKKGALPEKQSSDIEKKLECLNQQWAGGGGLDRDPPLNDEAREKLSRLMEATESEKWGHALQIQVALAVDHAGAVRKWVMAIKKLLLTAQSIFPESKNEDQRQPQPPSSSRYFHPSHES